jgi:subtilisin family serine protease
MLTACGGGGGGGGSSSSSASSPTFTNSPEWTATDSEANSYRTTEYSNQVGLERVHAAEAYAVLGKNSKTVDGSGVKIAIVDTGVQTTHTDIAANYSASGSYDYVNEDADPTDDYGHGTFVAGVAAGAKNSSGIHGVAYGSTIIASKVMFPTTDSHGDPTVAGYSYDIADGINGALTAGSKIINLSLGSAFSSGGYTLIRNALIAAKSSDALSVIATGNDTATQPDYPAYYATDSALLGYVLAVGAVDATSTTPTIASFSNKCGDAAAYCLVAPGVDIVSSYPTTIFSSGYATGDGTSFATPFVAGAAAVIRGAWPHLTAVQTSQILLTTATDLGTSGVDSTYGHGMLNLYAAVQAQGQNTLGYGSSISMGGYEIADSSMVTSSIFGDAFASNVAPNLASAIFFDDYGRDYKANLASKIGARNSNNITNLNSLVFNNITAKTAPLQFGKDFRNTLKFNAATYKNPQAQNYFGLKFITLDRSIDPQNNLSNGLSLVRDSSDFAPNLKLGFAINVDEVANLEGNDFANLGFLSQKNLATNPYQSFMQSNSLTLQNNRQFNQFFAGQSFFAKKLALKFSYQSSYDSTQMLSKIGNKQNQILDFGLSLKPKSGSNFLVSLGNLSEFDNNILNSRSVGAFESGGGVKTSYAKISASQNLTKNLQFLASYSEGVSKINGNQQGIFREFDNVRSRSLSASLLLSDFYKGKLGLGYLEPMRVYQGSVKIDIPVARDLAGNLTRLQSKSSLASQGRERDLEIFYLRELSEVSQVKFNFVKQIQAGNIKNAPTNYLGFMQFSLNY